MKGPVFIAILVLFISPHAISADFSEGNGITPNGQHIVIDGETGEILPNGEASTVDGSPNPGSPLNLWKVCDYTGYPGKFTCKKIRGSPLSGATYIGTVSKQKKDACGAYYRIFLCVDECSSVPKIFYLEPWEC
jgi:hypothetical protein